MSPDLARALARLERAHRDAADALAAIAAAHAEPSADPAELVPHTRWPFSRRVACKLARTGKIKATRSGKSWIATRAELDRYVTSCPTGRPTTHDDDTAADALEAIRARYQ